MANCIKCGKELSTTKVFCQECLEIMEKYPVATGTPIVLHPRSAAVQKAPVKKKPSAEAKAEKENTGAVGAAGGAFAGAGHRRLLAGEGDPGAGSDKGKQQRAELFYPAYGYYDPCPNYHTGRFYRNATPFRFSSGGSRLSVFHVKHSLQRLFHVKQ